METGGINWILLTLQLLNIGLLLGWAFLAVVALVRMRRHTLSSWEQTIWAALILLVPILGALAFLIVQPGQRAHMSSK